MKRQFHCRFTVKRQLSNCRLTVKRQLNQCQHLVIKLPSGQKTQAIFRIIAHEYMGTTLYSNAEAQVKLLSIFNQFKEYMNSP